MFKDNSELKPTLINKNIAYKFKQMLKTPKVENDNQWESFLMNFYKSYIAPNLFTIFIFLLIILFLVYKFFTKKKEHFEEEIYDTTNLKGNTYDDIQDDISDTPNNIVPIISTKAEEEKVLTNMKKNTNKQINTNVNTNLNKVFDEPFRPTFNPYYPTDFQTSYVNYLPNELYFDVNGEYINYNDIHPHTYTQSYMPLPNKFSNPDTFTGIENTLYGATNPPLPDPLGEIADYNTSTEKAMQFMTSKNRENLDLLTEIIFENPATTNNNTKEWESQFSESCINN
jgi:hypothetical protein